MTENGKSPTWQWMAGIFDVVTQDTANMWCYATFAAINKAAGDSLVITWTLTYA